jgi:hypothetical protein
MGAGRSITGGITAGISAGVMALAATGAGYSYALWREYPTATDVVGSAALSTLEPIVPGLFAFCIGLFVLGVVSTVYSVRQLRSF